MANPIGELLIAIGVDAHDAQKALDAVVTSIKETGANASTAIETLGTSAKESAQEGAQEVKALGDEAQKAGEKGKAAGKEIQMGFNPIGKLIGNIKAELKNAMGVMGAAFAIKKTFGDYLDAADSLSTLSQQTRMSMEDLYAWGKASEAAGGSAQAMYSSLKSFADKNMMSGEGLIKIAKRVQGMNDVVARSYLKSIGVAEDAMPIFMKSGKEAEELVQKYRKTAFTQQDAREARSFRMAWLDFGVAARSVGNGLVRTVLPGLTQILKFFEALTESMRENKALWAGIAAGMSVMYAPKALAGLQKVIKALKSMSAASLMATGVFGLIALAIAAVGAAIDDLITFAEGGESFLEDFMKSSGASAEEIESLRQSAIKVKDAFKEYYDALKPLIAGALVNFLKPAVELIAAGIVHLAKWIALIPEIPKWFSSVKDSINTTIDEFKGKITNLPEAIGNAFRNAKEAVTKAIGDWWEDFKKNFILKIPDALGNAFTGFKNFLGFGDDDKSGKPDPAAQQAAAARAARGSTVNTQSHLNQTVNMYGVKDGQEAVNSLGRVSQDLLNRNAMDIANANTGVVATGSD